MSTAQAHNEINKESMDSPVNGINGNSDHFDHATGLPQQPMKQRKPYDYGGNPLAHVNTGDPPLVVISSPVFTSLRPPSSPTQLLWVSALSR
jgi:hypothetical protein